MPRACLLLAAFLLLAGDFTCADREAERKRTSASSAKKTESAGEAAIPRDDAALLRYRRVPIPGPAALVALRDSLGRGGFLEVLKVNRCDLRHVRAGDSLIVPAEAAGATMGDSLRCSPFPRVLPLADSPAKLLLVSLRVQAFAAYEHGRLVRWGPTSTGRKTMPTPAGLFHANWKDKERNSTVSEEWHLTWCINLDNFAGVSLHQYELPGYPASHSCVRLLEEDACWLYGWVEQWRLTPDGSAIRRPGTPVLIFGEYAYGARPPWKRLPEDPAVGSLSPAEVAAGQRLGLTGPS